MLALQALYLRDHLPSPSTLFFETMSLTKAGADCLAILVGQLNSPDMSVPDIPSNGAMDALILAWQGMYSLSYLPRSPCSQVLDANITPLCPHTHTDGEESGNPIPHSCIQDIQ